MNNLIAPEKNRVRTFLLAMPHICLLTAMGAGSAEAQQQTFNACYVPDVGAVYMVGLEGLPPACLSSTHQPMSWKDGGDSAIAAGAVGTAELADDAVTADKIAAGSVDTAELADAAVATRNLASGSVTSEKLAAGSVTSDKLGLNYVIRSGTISRSGSLTTAQLDCPQGQDVLSGSWSYTSFSSLPQTQRPLVVRSQPTDDGKGWLILIHDVDDLWSEGLIHIVCANLR